MNTVLGLKLSRRLTAAVATSQERVVFHDTRFVPGNKALRERSIARYLIQLIGQTNADHLFYYAPGVSDDSADPLRPLIERVMTERGVAVTRLFEADLFNALGVVPTKNRRELNYQLGLMWPQLAERSDARALALAEACVCAFVGGLRMGIGA